MTIGELKKILAEYPDAAKVMIRDTSDINWGMKQLHHKREEGDIVILWMDFEDVESANVGVGFVE